MAAQIHRDARLDDRQIDHRRGQQLVARDRCSGTSRSIRQHGPHKGGCADCRGVVTIDPATGAITRNVEYYVLGHASRFVLPGA